MKVRTCFLLLAVMVADCLSAAIFTSPIQYLPMEDDARGDWPNYEELTRIKRGSSGDILGIIKNSLSSKVAQFAQASAGAAGHFSKGPGGGHHYDEHSYGVKPIDWWGVKKSILNTLLQAVKAIKGGIITIKGELIKGSSHLIAAKAKFIGKKGEKISEFGRHIINSAVPPQHEHVAYSAPSGHGPTGPVIHHEYGPPSSTYEAAAQAVPSAGYINPSGYSGPAPEYGAPTAPYLPQKINSAIEALAKNKLPPGMHAGIVLLKKIPAGGLHSGSLPLEHKVPNFKPLSPYGKLSSLFESNLKEVLKPETVAGPPVPNGYLPSLFAPAVHAPVTSPVVKDFPEPTLHVTDLHAGKYPDGFAPEFSKGPAHPDPYAAFDNKPLGLADYHLKPPLTSYDLPSSGNPESHSVLQPAVLDYDKFNSPDAFASSLGAYGPVAPSGPHGHPSSGLNFDLVKSVSYELPQKRH